MGKAGSRDRHFAIIDLTKTFDLVSRKILFNLQQKIVCPTTQLRLIASFHDDIQGTIQYDGSTSAPFPIKNDVKQGCVLAPMLSSLCCFHTLSDHLKTVCTYTQKAKESCSILHDFGERRK